MLAKIYTAEHSHAALNISIQNFSASLFPFSRIILQERFSAEVSVTDDTQFVLVGTGYCS